MQLSDLKKAVKGVVIVQTTPFNKDASLDLEGMRANTRWLLDRTSRALLEEFQSDNKEFGGENE